MTWKSIAATFLMTGILVAASPMMATEPVAALSQHGCGQGTIQGRYGYYGQGEIVSNDFGSPPVPRVTFGTATFDGEGSFRWTSSDLPGVQLTGTYALRRNCTGSITFNLPDPFPPATTVTVIVVDGGNEMWIATPPPPDNLFVGVLIYKRQ